MKKYFLPERLFLGKVITGVKTLTRESDAYLAEILQIHRANVTAFNSQKRPHSLSAESVDGMLRHYGFVFDPENGLAAAQGNFCPLVSLRCDHDQIDSRVDDFIQCLQANQSQRLQVLKIGNEPGAFALLWDLNEKTAEGWCAVALGLGANNSALEQFNSFVKPTDPTVMISTDVYLNWYETSPRKSEVLAACIDALRKKRSEDLQGNLHSAMSQNESAQDMRKLPPSAPDPSI